MREEVRSLHIDTEMGWRGGEQQAMYLMEGLKRRGHPVALACKPESRIALRAQPHRIELHELRMLGEFDFLAGMELGKIANEFGADIIHAHTAHAHPLAVIASKVSGAKCVVSRRVDFRIKKGLLSGLKYRTGVHRYIAISEAVKRVMVEDGVEEDRVSVVHSGIDPERFKRVEPQDYRTEFGIGEDETVVGNVAAMVDHKGQRYLVDAAGYVLQKAPLTRFVIIGDGELREQLLQQAKPYGEKIIFTGFREDVPSLILFFDIFVMSSHLEGLCTSIMDAMYLERPVVATTAGGIPEIIDNGVDGILVEPKNPEALAEAILEVINDVGLRRRLASAGKHKVIQKFTADAMVERTLSVYRELLSDQQSRREKCRSE